MLEGIVVIDNLRLAGECVLYGIFGQYIQYNIVVAVDGH